MLFFQPKAYFRMVLNVKIVNLFTPVASKTAQLFWYISTLQKQFSENYWRRNVNLFTPVASKTAQLFWYISTLQKQFSENYWRRNVDQNLTHKYFFNLWVNEFEHIRCLAEIKCLLVLL